MQARNLFWGSSLFIINIHVRIGCRHLRRRQKWYHTSWKGSHIAASTTSHSQNAFECPITCISFLPSFHECFWITKMLVANQKLFPSCGAVKIKGGKIITNITQKKKKGDNGGRRKSRPSCLSCNFMKHFCCFQVLQPNAGSEQNPALLSKLLPSCKHGDHSCKQRERKICKFKQIHSSFSTEKKSFHVIWNSQTARVMFLHINGNPFWYLHYWFLHFL